VLAGHLRPARAEGAVKPRGHGREHGVRLVEVEYRSTARWVYPILRAIQDNPVLATRHNVWRRSALSDLAFAIETRLTYLPQVIRFINDNLTELHRELSPLEISGHLERGTAFRFRNVRAVDNLLFGTTTFITESRSCFENLAAFYRLFLETYCSRRIQRAKSYNVVARSPGKYAWASALHRIRGDLIHARSLFLAFDVTSTNAVPVFSMNWRPGRFGRGDRIELHTLIGIWEGLRQAVSAMSAKIAGIATSRKR
jgi:hypothetical protein